MIQNLLTVLIYMTFQTDGKTGNKSSLLLSPQIEFSSLSAFSRRLLMDVLLPAELFFLTFPGMVLMIAGASSRKTDRRVLLVLTICAAAGLLLCQGLAFLSGIATGKHDASGPAWYVILVCLAVFDIAVVVAPFAGIAALRHMRAKGSV